MMMGSSGDWAITPGVEGVCISVAVSILKRPQCGWVGSQTTLFRSETNAIETASKYSHAYFVLFYSRGPILFFYTLLSILACL